MINNGSISEPAFAGQIRDPCPTSVTAETDAEKKSAMMISIEREPAISSTKQVRNGLVLVTNGDSNQTAKKYRYNHEGTKKYKYTVATNIYASKDRRDKVPRNLSVSDFAIKVQSAGHFSSSFLFY